MTSTTDYALLQQSTGATFLNTPTGQIIRFGVNNVYWANLSATSFNVSNLNANGLNVTDANGLNSTKIASSVYQINRTINITQTSQGVTIWNGMNNISGNVSGWYFA
jgi:hypothetical protein